MRRENWEVAEFSRFNDMEARIEKLLNTGEVTGAFNERMNNMEEESQGEPSHGKEGKTNR
jgi:hypothetical protein